MPRLREHKRFHSVGMQHQPGHCRLARVFGGPQWGQTEAVGPVQAGGVTVPIIAVPAPGSCRWRVGSVFSASEAFPGRSRRVIGLLMSARLRLPRDQSPWTASGQANVENTSYIPASNAGHD